MKTQSPKESLNVQKSLSDIHTKIFKTQPSTLYDNINSGLQDKVGNIFAAGESSNIQGEYKGFLIKTNINGTLDNTFGTNGIVEIGDDNADDEVYFSNLKIQSDDL